MEKQGEDDAQLAAMGHRAELNRNFSMLYVAFYTGNVPLLTVLGQCWVWPLLF